MTVEIEMTDSEYNSINRYAAENKFGVAEFFFESALEKIEDDKFIKISNKIMKERAKVYKALAK